MAGGAADRALDAQARTMRQAAEEAAADLMRLSVQAVRETLARIEEEVASDRPRACVRSDALPIEPPPFAARSLRSQYGSWSPEVVRQLLPSADVTPNGLPEAVVARTALALHGDVATESDAADVGERLLAGELPVRREDLPYLARLLGKGDDPRVESLQARLRAAPAAESLPLLPRFERRLRSDRTVEGWAHDSYRDRRVRYQVPIDAVLRDAGVSGRAAAVRGENEARTLVRPLPDIRGLFLSVALTGERGAWVQSLRVALWGAVLASLAALVAVQRSFVRTARATAREKAFLAAMTHELKTPLSSIRLLAETLADGRGQARAYGALVAQETERLESLVDRVLAASRIDEAPVFATVDPGRLVRSAVEVVRPRAERQATTLSCRVQDGLAAARWDADAVERALVNLLDNAIRHGRAAGQVEVCVAQAGAMVRMSVRDDGPGIAASHRRAVFRRFGRGPTTAPGTGLGLYLVDQVARAHGGRVDLLTEEGHGCTFTLALPALPPGAPEPSGLGPPRT